ncbi:MAG: YfhO family protein, partial [Chloroflexota bacterium]|nr:YfhO family protein [Chloroflexota bacterium]
VQTMNLFSPNTRFSTQRRAFFVDLGVATLIAVFALALYYRLLFTNRVLASGDILLYFYPYRDYAAAAVRNGQIPLWNPYIFLGVPFLANPQAAVLYPLHWPLSWLTVTKQIYWSAALHTWLLGMGGYFLLRRWGQSAWAGLMGGLILAGSGFYGGLIGHLNQMNGAAWLPWAVLVLGYGIRDTGYGIRQGRNDFTRLSMAALAQRSGLLALLVALMVLAGHTQTAYINLFGIGVWTVWPLLSGLHQMDWRSALAVHSARLIIFSVGTTVGLLLSAAQLLPTLELSNLGLRSGGLTYSEASSFSLPLLRLPFTLLPTYGLVDLGVVFGVAGYTEFVAYVGLIGLALAVLGAWQGRGPARTFGLLCAVLGLFLAVGRWNPVYFLLYKVVPGFDLFRTPARWLMLYTLGMVLLAGVGFDSLWQKSRQMFNPDRAAHNPIHYYLLPIYDSLLKFSPILCTLLIALDLLLAARALPHTQPTAPQAVYDLRTAPAHVRTDPQRAAVDPAAAGRFLSMSTTRFDPGDAGDWQRILRATSPPQLNTSAFDQLLITLKEQEILAPNLPLLWRIPAVDGFDGGVLPLRRYLDFLTLLIPPDQLVPDGRLREQIKQVPNAHLLGLLNTQYVITDKVRDLWFEDVYYDRQIGARLQTAGPQSVQIEVPNPLEATHIGLIAYITGDAQALQRLQAQNLPVAEVIVQAASTATISFTLTAGGQAGADLADAALDSPLASTGGATIAYRNTEDADPHQEYRVRLALPQPTQPVTITVQRLDTPFDLHVQAATLIDARTTMFTPLLPSDRGRFQLVHSGDVKVYENLAGRARTYLAHTVMAAANPEHALDLVRSALLTTTGSAVIEGLASFTAQPAATDTVEIVAYAPQRVEIQAHTTERALLVLSDTFYPGWTATVDGEPAPIYTTNYLFRGVPLPPGNHTVLFRYQPLSWQRGLWVSGLGGLLCLLLLTIGWLPTTRRSV